MAVQSTDKFLVNRAGASYQAPFTSLLQGITTDVSIGAASSDGAQMLLNSTENVQFPQLTLRRSASNGRDIKMLSLPLGGDNNESTNFYDSCSISLRMGVSGSITATDTSASKQAQLQLNSPSAINLAVNGAQRMTVKSDGTINFSNVSVYESNALAKSSGLDTGDVYRKSTGELMIVF